MRKILIALMAAGIVSAGAAAPGVARADDGSAVAAGVAGGLLGGLLLGGALAPRPYYYEPAPVYVQPYPVYVAPGYRCYWTRGAPYWDDYVGVWRRPRVRVCD